eukprot:TRINITY_DN1262_c0_g1_i21.p1 TRINITY_DN1262_c0_g1~~TRINITY_DN1262_c0_g1_i21.p1  ORF type:complete len:117 (+),score=22.38 TRINITY_DN1262_c0_g1_i21:103-453(+)
MEAVVSTQSTGNHALSANMESAEALQRYFINVSKMGQISLLSRLIQDAKNGKYNMDLINGTVEEAQRYMKQFVQGKGKPSWYSWMRDLLILTEKTRKDKQLSTWLVSTVMFFLFNT